MKKILTGAFIGFLAAPLLAFAATTARLWDAYCPLNHAMMFACMFCPFWAVPGLVTGAVVGAVVGLCGGAKRAKAAPTYPRQGASTSSDTLKSQPGGAKCPFCRSTTFRVEKEVGLRRCSDCHSILPNYIPGNA